MELLLLNKLTIKTLDINKITVYEELILSEINQ